MVDTLTSARKARPVSGALRSSGGAQECGRERKWSFLGPQQPGPGSGSSRQWLRGSHKEATPWRTRVGLFLSKWNTHGRFPEITVDLGEDTWSLVGHLRPNCVPGLSINKC